jgi:hypothetical protein
VLSSTPRIVLSLIKWPVWAIDATVAGTRPPRTRPRWCGGSISRSPVKYMYCTAPRRSSQRGTRWFLGLAGHNPEPIKTPRIRLWHAPTFSGCQTRNGNGSR